MRNIISNSFEELTAGLLCKLNIEFTILSLSFFLKIIHDLGEPLIIQDCSNFASVSDEFLDSIDVSKVLINHFVNFSLNLRCKFLSKLFNLFD